MSYAPNHMVIVTHTASWKSLNTHLVPHASWTLFSVFYLLTFGCICSSAQSAVLTCNSLSNSSQVGPGAPSPPFFAPHPSIGPTSASASTILGMFASPEDHIGPQRGTLDGGDAAPTRTSDQPSFRFGGPAGPALAGAAAGGAQLSGQFGMFGLGADADAAERGVQEGTGHPHQRVGAGAGAGPFAPVAGGAGPQLRGALNGDELAQAILLQAALRVADGGSAGEPGSANLGVSPPSLHPLTQQLHLQLQRQQFLQEEALKQQIRQQEQQLLQQRRVLEERMRLHQAAVAHQLQLGDGPRFHFGRGAAADGIGPPEGHSSLFTATAAAPPPPPAHQQPASGLGGPPAGAVAAAVAARLVVQS